MNLFKCDHYAHDLYTFLCMSCLRSQMFSFSKQIFFSISFIIIVPPFDLAVHFIWIRHLVWAHIDTWRFTSQQANVPLTSSLSWTVALTDLLYFSRGIESTCDSIQFFVFAAIESHGQDPLSVASIGKHTSNHEHINCVGVNLNLNFSCMRPTLRNATVSTFRSDESQCADNDRALGVTRLHWWLKNPDESIIAHVIVYLKIVRPATTSSMANGRKWVCGKQFSHLAIASNGRACSSEHTSCRMCAAMHILITHM